VNGAIFEARAWQPYRWDITSRFEGRLNDLQINVFATPCGPRRRRSAAGGRTGGAPAAGGRRPRRQVGRARPAAAAAYWPAEQAAAMPRRRLRACSDRFAVVAR
jgi:hypothetical protein